MYSQRMNSFSRNIISKLYNAASAPVAATGDALAERQRSVRKTASLLYKRMMNNMGYGQERFKDTLEKEAGEEEAKEEHEKPAATNKEEEVKGQQQELAAAKEQQQDDEQCGTVPKIKLVHEGKRVKVLNKFNTKMVMANITPHIEMRAKVIHSFELEIHRGGGEIVDYSKTFTSPPGMFTILEEIPEYIEECEEKRLDMDNKKV